MLNAPYLGVRLMKRIYLALHFAVPLLTFFYLSKGAVGGTSGGEWLLLVTANFAFFALPHFAWWAVATSFSLQGLNFHAGFLAANISLVGLTINFECCTNNDNGLGWFYYYPVAFGAIVAVGLVMVLAGGRGEKQA